MDTSKEYIKMCTKAHEIQELWQGEVGDVFSHLYSDPPTIKTVVDEAIRGQIRTFKNLKSRHFRIWLPRQDQLQEMVIKDLWLVPMIHKFYKWCCEEAIAVQRLRGMEQLWLAFVMKEKFNKKWNGTNWEAMT